jgi:hypothetical protein
MGMKIRVKGPVLTQKGLLTEQALFALCYGHDGRKYKCQGNIVEASHSMLEWGSSREDSLEKVLTVT